MNTTVHMILGDNYFYWAKILCFSQYFRIFGGILFIYTDNPPRKQLTKAGFIARTSLKISAIFRGGCIKGPTSRKIARPFTHGGPTPLPHCIIYVA